MMRRLPDRHLNALAEACTEVRLSTIFRVEGTEAESAATDHFPTQRPYFPLFRLPESFRYSDAESQKNIQNP
jgi:hypothetical protein